MCVSAQECAFRVCLVYICGMCVCHKSTCSRVSVRLYAITYRVGPRDVPRTSEKLFVFDSSTEKYSQNAQKSTYITHTQDTQGTHRPHTPHTQNTQKAHTKHTQIVWPPSSSLSTYVIIKCWTMCSHTMGTRHCWFNGWASVSSSVRW